MSNAPFNAQILSEWKKMTNENNGKVMMLISCNPDLTPCIHTLLEKTQIVEFLEEVLISLKGGNHNTSKTVIMPDRLN